MLFRKDGNRIFRVDINVDEDSFIQVNPDYIIIDDSLVPASESGVYIINDAGELIPDPEIELETKKENLLLELSDYFDNFLVANNWFTCSLGFPVDNRRSGSKHDKDNVQSLIDAGKEPVLFKDHNNNFQTLTLEDLKKLKQEMIENGLELYKWKFQKEQEILNATEESIENISIEYEFK